MNLTEQTVSAVNEVNLTDSLNASLMRLKVTMGAESSAPSSNDFFIYVDKESSSNPTEERRKYLFELTEPLRFYNGVGDELLQEIKIIDNDVVMTTKVNRKIGVNEEGNNYVLDNLVTEEIKAYPVTLFEGVNYIYTNYTNANIELVYPKDTEENKMFLNNAIYYNHKLKNDGEFSLDDIYFKDAFTKTEDKLNLEVNNVNIDCLTSKNNKFSLDSEGNLIVNSITTALASDSLINNESICNLIYPVGSIYMSVNSVNPATLFGGTWEQLKDRFLLGAGNTYGNGKTGGEAMHTLTINEMPSHNHYFSLAIDGGNEVASKDRVALNGFGNSRWWSNIHRIDNTGGNQAHNNMPPYLVVYMWKRVS